MGANRPRSEQRSKHRDFVEGELSREIVGAFYDVYNALGPGFVTRT